MDRNVRARVGASGLSTASAPAWWTQVGAWRAGIGYPVRTRADMDASGEGHIRLHWLSSLGAAAWSAGAASSAPAARSSLTARARRPAAPTSAGRRQADVGDVSGDDSPVGVVTTALVAGPCGCPEWPRAVCLITPHRVRDSLRAPAAITLIAERVLRTELARSAQLATAADLPDLQDSKHLAWTCCALLTTPSAMVIGPQPIGHMPTPPGAFSQMISMQRRQYHVV
eukprot:CAMPEP_0180112840 /NCGR_PEP_ID=MMETSP0985-20121206/36437_1 /TAXON_ID=483367 /ORGANISM="non described non described, Strain CCMP 2436" /LENGTH=226 /DNA_ID=CAMNT_0022051251 /DNA_START=67 /DNA_END=745 /DNA_ORIENTATION=+